jgi:translation initiation factor IF-3
VREVRLIDPDGNQVGILPIHQALAKANDFGLDLVEISPNAKPPVCKIMDYGRFKYEQTKKTAGSQEKADHVSDQRNQGPAKNRRA